MSGEAPKQEQSQPKSDADYEAMRTTVMQKKSIESISNDDLPYFVNYMTKYKMYCLDKEDYIGAKDAAAILEACKQEDQTRQTNTQKEQQNESTQNSLNEKKQKLEEKLKKFDEDTNSKQQAMQERQTKEIEEFEKKWREEMPDKYRRMPKQLIELRETARTLALAGHYDEAQQRKVEADNLEQEEAKNAQNRLNHDYRVAKNKLLTQHKLEVTKFNDSRAEKRDVIAAEIHVLEDNEKNREIVLRAKPANTRRSVNGGNESGSVSMSRSLPRKSQWKQENKLPPLRPPNESTKPGDNKNDAKSPQNNQQQQKKEQPQQQQKKEPAQQPSLAAVVKDKVDDIPAAEEKKQE
ncbi:hypothetical protein TVAG_148500 [Trichomonas vaginalis G3]|uniref:Uncharacterized protein n=1 Tax=Trichomonas vaginalis (strain ATCC PRA-98 / G3) TaxID=412133 RepID=A2GA79_TRIV3|nr:hypothetical protein TVAGG3_0260470 [Trichomonas vaginalis G3]EAX85937.1 hypothetical protein TVAG_148500 [Trichomonas vaginalis G3]KAI5525070.1 hypothetical protein TVAGG3_0260470 [Trichomonas vaginalis G3]|eukprot:XP_001298867.1 hypothetical protein [Trichomonas vaginalis G3]